MCRYLAPDGEFVDAFDEELASRAAGPVSLTQESLAFIFGHPSQCLASRVFTTQIMCSSLPGGLALAVKSSPARPSVQPHESIVSLVLPAERPVEAICAVLKKFDMRFCHIYLNQDNLPSGFNGGVQQHLR